MIPHPKALDIGMESYYFAVNMGSMLFGFIGSVSIPLIALLCLRPFTSKFKYAKNKHSELSDGLRGNIFIRFILEACLDIGLCVALQFWYSDLNNSLSFGTVFYAFNSSFTILLGSAVALILPFSIIFYIKRFADWDDEVFASRYGSFYDGLRTD